MRKTKTTDVKEKVAVNINQLQAMLGCGKATANKIGEDAGAVIRIGKRKLFSVNKVRAYIDHKTEEE